MLAFVPHLLRFLLRRYGFKIDRNGFLPILGAQMTRFWFSLPKDHFDVGDDIKRRRLESLDSLAQVGCLKQSKTSWIFWINYLIWFMPFQWTKHLVVCSTGGLPLAFSDLVTNEPSKCSSDASMKANRLLGRKFLFQHLKCIRYFLFPFVP